ncbi:unnamed protein product [Lupinus luteus]|uniref:Uncharacterized protein n=1 Tax=Lupinus luteus TaxID=3873 RepID=A0AAV1YLT9_LUPLU
MTLSLSSSIFVKSHPLKKNYAAADADARILMLSMLQTQYPTEKDTSARKDQDVFLTPHEKSLSLPISSDDPFDNVS